MPFRGEWPSLDQYTPEQLALYFGKVKLCPHCKLEKDIISGFGLRNTKAHTGKRYFYPRPWCRSCDQVASIARKPNSVAIPTANTKVYRDKHRKKINLRAVTRWHNPDPQPCVILGCTNPAERHHTNGYTDPQDFIWICKKHHWDQHEIKEPLNAVAERIRSAAICNG
jgi:hypothetical protein